MSQIGKYLLYVAALGLVASGVMGYLVAQKYAETRTNLTSESSLKAAALADAAQQKKLAVAAAQAQKEAETKVTETSAKVDALTTQLTDASKKASDAQAALDQVTKDGAKAKSDYDDLMKQLNGQTVPDLIAAKDKALADMQSAQSEQKIIQDQLQSSQNDVKRLMVEINDSKLGKIPPGISGKVTFVNRTWNFVVLDVGLSNGVVPNGQLIVYRKNTFLGKVKVTTADANSCVADILPDAKGDIQVGDYVLN